MRASALTDGKHLKMLRKESTSPHSVIFLSAKAMLGVDDHSLRDEKKKKFPLRLEVKSEQ